MLNSVTIKLCLSLLDVLLYADYLDIQQDERQVIIELINLLSPRKSPPPNKPKGKSNEKAWSLYCTYMYLSFCSRNALRQRPCT